MTNLGNYIVYTIAGIVSMIVVYYYPAEKWITDLDSVDPLPSDQL